MTQPRHVMIDLETMGLTPDSAIVSIGAVLFDPRYGIDDFDDFYAELDWKGQKRTIDDGTYRWWHDPNKVSPAARKALKGSEELYDVLTELTLWLPQDAKVWGNGATFDITMLEDAYRQHGQEVPWKFWNIRDVRTIKDLYESARGGFDKKSGGTLHNALDDAKYQAQYVTMMWKSILANK